MKFLCFDKYIIQFEKNTGSYYTQQRYKEAQTLLNTATPYLEEYVIEQSNYGYIHDLVNCYVTQELINEKMRN